MAVDWIGDFLVIGFLNDRSPIVVADACTGEWLQKFPTNEGVRHTKMSKKRSEPSQR